jgi:hypothetical protein
MQPPIWAHGALADLPPLQDGDSICYVTKCYRYVSLVPKDRATGIQRNDLVLTLHQAEARRLGEALLAAAGAPVSEDFATVVIGGTEGLFAGGPPRRDQLVEFNPELLKQG